MNKKVAAIIAVVLGLALVGFGVYLQFFQTKGFKQTDATITRIDKNWRAYNNETMEDEYDYDVYVKYTVDGKEYEGKADTYDESYAEGKEITVFYNPSNPAEIHGDSGIVSYFLMGIGAIVAVVGVVMLVRRDA